MADWDTALKRFSGMGLGDIDPMLPIPDGSVDTEDRPLYLELYSGIAAGAPSSPPSGTGAGGSGRSDLHRRNTVRSGTTRTSSVR